ncbi:MAG: hypothetical protein FRX49_08711 [Trebouxia sp. A1-2]|nr:MAG: hypothetical protein FRX49_08711 [Trebouxia sp. A1-2]
MSESEPSQAQLQEGVFQSDDVDQLEQPFVEELELQSVEEATALLRSCWKFAAVIQFSRMFATPLRLKVFAADILESALISPDNHRMFLSELLFKLLRTDALQPYSEKDSEGWESLLYRKVSTKWPEHFESHPLLGTTFYDITPTKRVDLLFALCDWRVHDCPVVKDVIKRTVELADSSVDGLRQEPVGEDTKGNLYYYFSFNNEDCRLYRQEPPFKKSAKRRRSGGEDAQWETVCTTVEEMADFVESLSAARTGKDKALHDLIATEILPQLIESAAARRRAEEKQAAIEAMPKKRSSRLQELTSKKEEEDKRKAQQLAEKLHRQRENERVRKEREREERLLARQREDERQMEIQRKLAGIHPEGPSREERLQRRLKSGQAGSSSDSGGIQIEQSPHNARSSARLHAQQQQQAQQQSSPPPHSQYHPQHHEQEYHQSQHHRQYQAHHHHQEHERQHQRQHQQPARQAQSRQQAQHEQHDQPDSSDHAQSGLLTRLRPRSTRRRTFQETFAWSPLDVPVPQRRRTDLDLRPRKNVAGLVAAAQGMSTGFGRNRRGKWVEEVGAQEVRGRSGGRPRSTKAASLSTAGPSSPAASWDSGVGRTQPKKLPHHVSSQQQYALEPEPTTSYGQQHLPPQQQQWQDPQRSGYATQSAPYAPSSTRWQQPQQQQLTQLSQQQQMTGQKAELESLVQQLTPQQRQHLATMPHDKRMQFFMNLRNQMARAQQAQQLQQQQQMSQRGAWQQGPGLQQAGPGAMRQPSASAQPATQSSQQQQQQQQYQQQLQQLTLSRLSPQQMQQLHALPVEQRAMQFGSYMRETQLQLQQQQHMQQQFPSQAMPTYSSSMVPVGQSHQQQQTGMSSHSQVAMQQQQRSANQQMPMRQMAMQQQGHMYSQPGIMRQQPGGFSTMGQAYPSSTGEQLSRPMSPPGLPRGPSNPMVVAQSPRSLVKSPTGGYLGPQMIRPQMAGQQMAGNQLAGVRMAGNQMAGVSGHVMPPNSPSALRSSSPGMGSGGSSNGGQQPTAQPQLGPQATHSATSRPNSASSAEGSGSAGQSHEAMVPKGRTASSLADQLQQGPRFQSTAGHGTLPMQQPSYGQNAYGLRWNGGMQTGSGPYANSGPSMQGQRPPPASMAMHGQGAQLDQNRLATRPGLAPAHLQHPAGSSPLPQQPAAPPLKAGDPAPSASPQVPVTGQLTSAHSSGSGNAMSHLGQTFVDSGQATNPYGSRNGMPAGPIQQRWQSVSKPICCYRHQSRVCGSYGGAGTNSYSGLSPRSGGVSVLNGVLPVQSAAGVAPQTSLHQIQKQATAAVDEQQTQTAVAPQPGAAACTEGVSLNPAAAALAQDPSQQAAANEMPGNCALGSAADSTQDAKQPDGVQLESSNQENADTSDLDVLADAPQLIEPPMVGGQENFSDGLFAD